MKYKTFRMLVILGGLGAVIGIGHLLPDPPQRSSAPPSTAAEAPLRVITPPAPREPVRSVPPVPPAPPAAPLPAGAFALRPMDAEILAAAALNIGGDKVKDAIRGRAWKVNLYKDAGRSGVNRAKIDLNRNDKWDESWTWLPEGIKRQVAPADDEKYTEESWYRPELNAWTLAKPGTGSPASAVPAAAQVATAPVATAPVATAPVVAPSSALALRPLDAEILSAVALNIPGDKVKDAIRGRAWKVNFYKDAGKSGINRLKIDLNRNDKWDESWTLGPDGILREVAPADDERYTQKFFLTPGGSAWTGR